MEKICASEGWQMSIDAKPPMSEEQLAEQEAQDEATGFVMVSAHLNMYTALITKNQALMQKAFGATRDLLNANPGFIERYKKKVAEAVESARAKIGEEK
jgi:hypothetical protein